MRSLFEKNLMHMKQELTDLKTAQKRGLGTIRFYTETKQVTLSQGVQVNITVKLDPDGYFPGFMELVGGPLYGQMEVTANSLTYQASVFSQLSKRFQLTVVSSTPIQSLEVTYS